MIKLRTVFYQRFVYLMDFLDKPQIKKIFRRVFKDDFNNWLKDPANYRGGSKEDKWSQFIDDVINYDMEGTIYRICDEYIRRYVKAGVTTVDWSGDDEVEWYVEINQVIAETKEDIVQIVEVYAEKEPLSELVVDAITDKL